MEPCVNGNEILNCYSPPPVFDIEKPSWCFTPTETPIPSTELTTTGEPTTITETTATTTLISAISSTISTILSSTQGITTKEPPEASSIATITEEPSEPVTEKASENLVPIIVPCVVIGILIIVLIVLCWKKKRQKERENQQAAAKITYDSQKSTVGLINGSDETDGAKAATSPQKESFAYKNEFSIAENENELPTKEVEANKEKRAPIVPSTEL